MAKEQVTFWVRKNKYESLLNSGVGFKYLPLSDGTDHHPPAPNPKIKWRGDSQAFFSKYPPPPGYGIADRVKDIADCFMPPPDRDDEYSHELVEDEDDDDFEWKEGLLEELQAYDAESIDVASVLHSKGRLFSFLGHVLSDKHACIRSMGAEVVTTMVEYHPTNRQLLIEEKCLQLLLNNFTSDTDETSRTKALGAISSLIRNNETGITAFQLEKGYAALKKAFNSRSVCQREVRKLGRYLLREKKKRKEGTNEKENKKGRNEGGNSGQLVKNDDKLKQVLQGLPSAATPTVQSNSSLNLH